MIEEIKTIKSGRNDLRKFGVTIGIVLLVIAGFLFWKEKESFWLLLIGITLITIGLVIPVVLKPVYWAWMVFAAIIGWIMTRVILSVLFYIVFTLIGLISRMLGKQFLELKWDKSKSTYWNYRQTQEFKGEDYERQF